MSITQDSPATTTSGVDVSGFEQMLVIPEKAIPCDNTIFHTGDEPAVWVVVWKIICPCAHQENTCQRCLDQILECPAPLVRCGICATIVPGPLRRVINRVEPLR